MPVYVLGKFWYALFGGNANQNLGRPRTCPRDHDESWTHQVYRGSDNKDILLRDLVNGSARGGCDGSFHPWHNRTSCAWRLESHYGKQFVEGGGIVPGLTEDNNAYRGENGGIYSLLLELQHLLQVAQAIHKDPPQGILISSDCLSTLQWVIHHRTRIKAQMKHSDLISIIKDKLNKIPTPITWVHVHSHQKSSDHPLTPNAVLNEKMDKLAKEINQMFATPSGSQGKGGICSIHVKGTRITGNVSEEQTASHSSNKASKRVYYIQEDNRQRLCTTDTRAVTGE